MQLRCRTVAPGAASPVKLKQRHSYSSICKVSTLPAPGSFDDMSNMCTARSQAAQGVDPLTSPPVPPIVYIISGVSASGKSTVGELLAKTIPCKFYEGDDLHPQSNIDKMKSGHPLDDNDRAPWLHKLADIVQSHVNSGEPAVMSCSALKRAYRDVLRGGGTVGQELEHAEKTGNAGHTGIITDGRVGFVLVRPSRDVLHARLKERAAKGTHFMPPSLLDSQLATLEVEPGEMYLLVCDDGCNLAGAHYDLPHCSGFPSPDIIVEVLMDARKAGQEGVPMQPPTHEADGSSCHRPPGLESTKEAVAVK